MKRLILGIATFTMLSSSAYAGCVYKDGYVVCDGSKVGSVWCGIAKCTANCLKGYNYGSSDDRYSNKDKAIQGILARCKK